MISFSGSLKVFLSVEPVDMRAGFERLSHLVSEVLKEDLRQGTLFVFSNRRHTRLKILYFDGTGLWLMCKRLEQGTFAWPKGQLVDSGKLNLAPEAFAMLTDGVDLRGARMRPWYQRE